MKSQMGVKRWIPLIRGIIAIVIFSFLLNLVVSYVLKNSIVPNLEDYTINSVFLFGILIDFVFAAFGLAMFRLVDKKEWRKFGFRFNRKLLLLSILCLIVMLGIILIYLLIVQKFNIGSWSKSYDVNMNHILRGIVFNGIIIGIGEEFLYRGYLYNTFKSYGNVFAYILSGVIFVFPHFLNPGVSFNVFYLMELITATFLLIYIYDCTGSIWPGVIIHSGIDLSIRWIFWSSSKTSIINFYFWNGKIDYVDAYGLLYVVINIILILVVWLFYGRKAKASKSKLDV